MNIIKIKRQNGKIELVDITAKWPTITQEDYDKMVRLNREAGRGEILGFAHGGITSKAELDARMKVAGKLNPRRTVAAILGGSLDENDDINATALRGGY
jgi:hypothetical protein